MGRSTYDLTQQRAKVAQISAKPVPPPAGVVFETDEQKLLWSQLVLARLPKDWRTLDLRLLAKVVLLETQITEQQEKLDREDWVLEGAKGGMYPNPRTGIIHQMQTRQLGLLRALALTTVHTTKTASASAERAAETERDRETLTKGSKKGPASLLA